MELKGKKGDFDYAQSPKHLPENLRNPNGADRCLNDRSLTGADRDLSGAEGSGYKHTEIGLIPEDWDYPALVDYGNLKNGFSFKSDFFANQGGNIVITPGNFKLEGGLDLDSEKNIYYTSSYSENEILKNGDLVLVMTDLTSDCNLLGKAGIINSKKVILHNQRIGKIIFNENVILKEYLYFFFNSDIFSRRMKANATGSTVRHTSKGTILNSKIPLPPLPEQQKIAEALGDTDALIQSLKKLIAKKKDIKQGAMQELLSGKRRLEGFDGEWENVKLGEICFIKTGSKNNQDKSEDGEYPFFVRSQFVERINSYSYDCEAVLIPGEGGIGSIFHYINGKFDVHQRVYVINEFKEGISAKFIYLYMKEYFGEHALKNTVKATVDSLRLPTFQDFKLIFPKSKKEQTRIAQILSDMDAEIEALEKKLQKIEFLKQGMMQELLTGRIRLVKPQAEMPAMVAEEEGEYGVLDIG